MARRAKEYDNTYTSGVLRKWYEGYEEEVWGRWIAREVFHHYPLLEDTVSGLCRTEVGGTRGLRPLLLLRVLALCPIITSESVMCVLSISERHARRYAMCARLAAQVFERVVTTYHPSPICEAESLALRNQQYEEEIE